MEHGALVLRKGDGHMDLPPGFRFHPTDEELITHYLCQKVIDASFHARAIGEVDLNKSEPWDLPFKARTGEKAGYFFCLRDKKYPTGSRTNRATKAGYWKATGKDKEIHQRNALIGMKKTLVFYKGRAPKGEKTNWVMHEYRLERKDSVYHLCRTTMNEWVICKVFHKNSGEKKDTELVGMGSWFEDGLDSTHPVPLMKDSHGSKNKTSSTPISTHVTCFSNALEGEMSHEELLQNCYKFAFLSASNSSPSSLNSTHRAPQNPGASLLQLLENNGYSMETSFKIERDITGIPTFTNNYMDMYMSDCPKDTHDSAWPLHPDGCF